MIPSTSPRKRCRAVPTALLAACLLLLAAPAAGGAPGPSPDGLAARLEIERGRGLFVGPEGLVELGRSSTPLLVQAPAHLELAAGGRARLAIPGLGSVELEGPAALAWSDPGGPQEARIELPDLHRARIELRTGRLRVDLPDAWRLELRAGAVALKELPGGGTELENLAGYPARASWLGAADRARPGRWIAPGGRARLQGGEPAQPIDDPSARAPRWAESEWPWGDGGISDPPDIALAPVEDWEAPSWPWGTSPEDAEPWESWGWPWGGESPAGSETPPPGESALASAEPGLRAAEEAPIPDSRKPAPEPLGVPHEEPVGDSTATPATGGDVPAPAEELSEILEEAPAPKESVQPEGIEPDVIEPASELPALGGAAVEGPVEVEPRGPIVTLPEPEAAAPPSPAAVPEVAPQEPEVSGSLVPDSSEQEATEAERHVHEPRDVEPVDTEPREAEPSDPEPLGAEAGGDEDEHPAPPAGPSDAELGFAGSPPAGFRPEFWRGLEARELRWGEAYALERDDAQLRIEHLPDGVRRFRLASEATEGRWYFNSRLDLRLLPGASLTVAADGSVLERSGDVRSFFRRIRRDL